MTSFHPSLSKQKESDNNYPFFLIFSSEHKHAEMPHHLKKYNLSITSFPTFPPMSLTVKNTLENHTPLFHHMSR